MITNPNEQSLAAIRHAYLSVPGDLLDRLEMVDDHQGAGRGVRKGS